MNYLILFLMHQCVLLYDELMQSLFYYCYYTVVDVTKYLGSSHLMLVIHVQQNFMCHDCIHVCLQSCDKTIVSLITVLS